jgi:hypothetical protein
MKRPSIIIIAVLAWLSATLAGTWAMMAYANAPGNAGTAPASWPAASRLPRPAGRPALIVFVHPHCPCSRASLGELALLMTHCAGRLEARAVFIDPAGMDAEWVETDLWRAAAAIPGVVAERDAGGREAQTFGTATSGDALLYDAAGRLIFHGGITVARGHAGENPGRRAIETMLHGETAPTAARPVFGCALFDGNQRGQPCKR